MGFDLTIVTCTMNSSLFIHDLLESLKSQSVLPSEHVFVDGNSRDETLSIIHEYSKLVPYPIVVLTQSPNGIASAMNLGALHASSRYLMHLHSDDKLYSSNSIEIAKETLSKSEADWFIANCEYIDIDGKHIGLSPDVDYSKDRLLVSNFISHPSVILSKDLFLGLGGFDESLKIAMDYDFWLRASTVVSPVQSNSILSCFRVHHGGTSSGNERKMWVEDLVVRLRYETHFRARLIARFRFVLNYALVGHPSVRSQLLKSRDILFRKV